MAWKIINQHNNIEQSGFDTKEDAERWLKEFKKYAYVKEGE